jgi:predicted anti-sigma-YlaC factor YlaD
LEPGILRPDGGEGFLENGRAENEEASRTALENMNVDCQDVLDQLADYLDPDAREDLSRAIEQHLSNCRDCRVEVDTIRKTVILYHSADKGRVVQIPVRVRQELSAVLASEYTRSEPGTRS